MKYTVARTKTADFKTRFTWILEPGVLPSEVDRANDWATERRRRNAAGASG
jgi:hypothetical protein